MTSLLDLVCLFKHDYRLYCIRSSWSCSGAQGRQNGGCGAGRLVSCARAPRRRLRARQASVCTGTGKSPACSLRLCAQGNGLLLEADVCSDLSRSTHLVAPSKNVGPSSYFCSHGTGNLISHCRALYRSVSCWLCFFL